MKLHGLIIALAQAPSVASAESLPPRAVSILPLLWVEVDRQFPNFANPQYFAGQIEQETCPSLKHSKCWNPHAELKTNREYGFGLGQITITSRFNTFEEVKGMDSTLREWEYEDRFNIQFQLRALVVKDYWNYRRFPLAYDQLERSAFMFAAYNGGLGGTLNDIKLCKAVKECDSSKWFGNVEYHSNKSRTKWKGYGKSAFDINREYPFNVIFVRSPRYKE